MQSDLIYDFGFHIGEDTEFYLKRGFRVVAVEANPDLCERGRAKFESAVRSGQLTIVNKAISDKPGKTTFFRNERRSEWGTIDPAWAARNARLGYHSDEITVEAITMADLLAEYGVPHFAKVDIEGFDMVAVQGLAEASERPTYISVEAEKDSFKALRHEFDVLASLGYDQFKVVSQSRVLRQRPRGVDHRFILGASGQFGEEAPGPWLTADQAIGRYKQIFFRHAVIGDDPVAPRWLSAVVRRLPVIADWYDTHAKLAGTTTTVAGRPAPLTDLGHFLKGAGTFVVLMVLWPFLRSPEEQKLEEDRIWRDRPRRAQWVRTS